MRRLLPLGSIVLAAALGAACTVQSTEIPDLVGPSEFGLSIGILATPDTLTQNGFAQSAIAVTARDPQGGPVSGLQVRLTMVVNGAVQPFGSLSPSTLTTGADGRATAMYTAPLAPPFMNGGPATLLEIYATPIRNDFQTAVSQHVEMLLLTPPVPKQSETAPIAAVTWAPVNPKVGDNVLFDASGSQPGPGRKIVSFYWNFGDNAPNDEHGHDASHVYTAPGNYTLVVGVVDDVGQIGSVFRTITVSQ